MPSSVIIPSARANDPSEWKIASREEATGTRRTYRIDAIPSIIVISGASIIVIALIST